MDSYDYHSSLGSCISFGNKPLYGCIDGKSVGTYTTKESKVASRQKIIKSKAEIMQEVLSDTVIDAVVSLSTIVPDLKYLLSTIIDTAEIRT